MILIDEKFLNVATTLIKTAEKSICISTFKAEISHKKRGAQLLRFFEEIMRKAEQGVKVRFLLNWNEDRKSVPKTNLCVRQTMRKDGIDIRYLKHNRCCHTKLLIVDDIAAITGSHNLSIRSCANNFEISYLHTHKGEVKELTEAFSRTFSDAKKWA